jgi:hypothetical protein
VKQVWRPIVFILHKQSVGLPGIFKLDGAGIASGTEDQGGSRIAIAKCCLHGELTIMNPKTRPKLNATIRSGN